MTDGRTELAVSADRLSKTYRVYASAGDRLREIVFRKPRHREFRALSDVSFEVPRGGALGVIGENGAGKSTLLKIVAGTTRASSGRVERSGSVASILELGMGFHPEFTGRENARMNAALLGLSGPEIRRRLPEIRDFAELGDFFDRPGADVLVGHGPAPRLRRRDPRRRRDPDRGRGPRRRRRLFPEEVRGSHHRVPPAGRDAAVLLARPLLRRAALRLRDLAQERRGRQPRRGASRRPRLRDLPPGEGALGPGARRAREPGRVLRDDRRPQARAHHRRLRPRRLRLSADRVRGGRDARRRRRLRDRRSRAGLPGAHRSRPRGRRADLRARHAPTSHGRR